jgi:parallel beta-helix repeat protein
MYTESVVPPAGVALYGGFVGTELQRGQRSWRSNATILDGAGNYNRRVVNCQEQNVVVDGFTLRNAGYGVYVSSGTATVANNTITGIGAIAGQGGIGVYVSSGAANLFNNTICGNGQSAVYVDSGTATLLNNTISGNGGSGVYTSQSSAAAALTNNVVAFNSALGFFNAGGAVPAFAHNDVYGNNLGDYSGYSPPATQGNISLDPGLSNIYHDVHLESYSPCVDAGDDTAVWLGETDVYGKPRIVGAHVDIGSDESDGTVWVVPPVIRFVSPAGDDGNDGLTWQTAKRTVTGAVSPATGTDEIWVAKGTYPESLTPAPGVALYGGFAGSETQRSQRNPKTNPTVLGGNTANIVTCQFPNIVVDGFALRNGYYGVEVSSGTATISNNSISGNRSAVYMDSNSAAIISGNTISTNGSGVYVNSHSTAALTYNTISGSASVGVYASASTATITNNAISGSGAAGVYADSSSTATIANNILTRNGSGVYVSGGSTGSITSNTISGNAGNGVYLYQSPATIAYNTISGNGSEGVYADSVSPAMITNNSISGNAGGVYVYESPATIQNNAIYGNPSGGVYVGFSSAATLTNNTISSNGSGVVVSYSGTANAGTAALTNNIVAFNSGYGLYNSGTISAFSHNDVFSNSAGDYSNYVPPDTLGNLGLDPAFMALSGADFRLQANSPCVDAGDDTAVNSGETDLDGKSRIMGAHVDIGAYEYDNTPVPYTLPELMAALKISGGLVAVPPNDMGRLNVVASGSSDGLVDVRDAVRLARKVAGLEANP